MHLHPAGSKMIWYRKVESLLSTFHEVYGITLPTPDETTAFTKGLQITHELNYVFNHWFYGLSSIFLQGLFQNLRMNRNHPSVCAVQYPAVPLSAWCFKKLTNYKLILIEPFSNVGSSYLAMQYQACSLNSPNIAPSWEGYLWHIASMWLVVITLEGSKYIGRENIDTAL